MIKSLKITNFQSHKESTLEFSNGVNVILGTTDSGKTAILRALRWVITNKPSGDTFRSHWAGKKDVTRVDLTLDSSDVVSRLKDEHINQYQVNSKEFNAIGTSVPKEIESLLNINEVNFQQQLDSPFLLNDSPGEVAQHFNHIAHLDSIGSALKNIQQWINGINQDLKKDSIKLEEVSTQIEEYDFLEKMEVDLEVLESLNDKFITLANNQKKLSDLLDSIKEVQDDLDESKKILVIETPVLDLLSLVEQVKQLQIQRNSLYDLLLQITAVNTDLEIYQDIIEDDTKLTEVLSLIEKQEALQEKYDSLYSLVVDIEKTQTDIEMSQEEAKKLEEEYYHLLPEECPICGRNTGGY